MKRGRDYAPTDTMFPLAGMDVLTPSTMLDQHHSPSVQNMLATDGIATKRKGYRHLSTIANADELSPIIVALIEFEVAIDVRILVAVTTKRQYRYDPASDLWVDITQLDTGVAVEWTGNQDDMIDWCIGRGVEGKYLIITNGKDTPQWWDGSADTFTDFPCDLPDFVTFKTIEQFYDHLFIGNVETSSSDKQSVAWSSVDTLTAFTLFPGGTPGGDAGSAIVTGAVGDIVKLLRLADTLVIYSENSISTIRYLGGLFSFNFEQIITESRLCGGRAIVNVGPYHIFLGQQNWYMYDGSRQLRSVGSAVHKLMRNELYVEQKNRAFAFLDHPNQYIYWGVPVNNNVIVIYAQQFDLFNSGNNQWTRLAYADQPLCMGFFSRDASLRWNSPSISTLRWKDADFTWISAAGRKGFPVRVVGSYGKVLLTDDTTNNDDGALVEAFWDTKDFPVPMDYESQFGRWIEIEAELSGVECDVMYSIDRGQTFVLARHVPLSPFFRVIKVPIDVVARDIRVRFYNKCVSSSFSLRWAQVWVQPGGAW